MSDRYFRVFVDCTTDTFTLLGELDMVPAAALRQTLSTVRSSTVVIDLSRLSFIDSSGLACLAATARERRVVLRGLRPRARRLLEVTDLQRLFDIEG